MRIHLRPYTEQVTQGLMIIQTVTLYSFYIIKNGILQDTTQTKFITQQKW